MHTGIKRMSKTAIQPTRDENYPEWYQQVIKAAELAENSPVRGCMVIKPWGYALWENLQKSLDAMFKATGHVNAYFPLFIPLSFLEKEAEHVEGFAKECAVVTHHRLKASPEGGLIPDGKLDEPLVVRPTSETIIGEMYAKWVQSYRDLPILINQWANVVRWEMRTRLFLRTTEFLWQEGHTAHETRDEAWDETLKMLDVYREFSEEYMAIPVMTGEKTANERFPGAENTFCIEAMMQDRKALQAGTSHFLGQNFAKSSNIQYQSREGKQELAWTTSWGVSTRLIGGMIMVHGDDDGMIVPPRLAPNHLVILPIIRDESQRDSILDYCNAILTEIQALKFDGQPVNAILDSRDINTGEKSWQWIKRGIPLILEIGPRDMEKGSVFVFRRDKSRKERYGQEKVALIESIPNVLMDIQKGLFDRAKAFQQQYTQEIGAWDEFEAYFTPNNPNKPEIHGGFAISHWCGKSDCEEDINDKLSVTIRCIPFDDTYKSDGKCICCGEKSNQQVVFAKSY